jgi:hypothetical protein
MPPDPTGNVLAWLFEEENPSVRYFTLIHLLGIPQNDRRALAARKAVMTS